MDYGILAKAFNHVLNNDILSVGEFEPMSGNFEDEVFQWYIIDENGAELLQRINEIVMYCSEFNLYIWGVTHWGTSWDYVLTDIKCNTGEVD